MMVRRGIREVKSGHVKYAGITKVSLARYRKRLRVYFDFLHVHDMEWPKSLEELDESVGEYINHMYKEGESPNYARETISALKRLYPRCKKGLETALHFTKCWGKELHRKRATVLPCEVLIGMVGLALAKDEPRVAVTFLLGFLGLLRTGELLTLVRGQLKFFDDSLCVIAMPESKGAKRKDYHECVLIHDRVAVRLIKHVVNKLQPDDKIFLGRWADLRDKVSFYAGRFGLGGTHLTPYCLRRGGATWHFTKYTSMDATQALGRWEQAKTAKIYINQSMSDMAAMELTAQQLRWIAASRRIIVDYPTLPPDTRMSKWRWCLRAPGGCGALVKWELVSGVCLLRLTRVWGFGPRFPEGAQGLRFCKP
jgi:integrase